jgi:hypothetical protein
MNAAFHGIEFDGDGKPVYMRFGMLRLVYRLWTSLVGCKPDERLKEWRGRIGSDDFKYQLNHFRQCIEKFDRASGHVARCRDGIDGAITRYTERIRRFQEGEITQPPDPVSDSDSLEMTELNKELPLFLDAMLFYLRIQADSFAQLVRFFYEPTKATVLSGEFAKQKKDFSKYSQFDPVYAAILSANHNWFNELIGDGGLRDVVTHESGMWGIAWEKPKDLPIKPRVSLYRRKGIVEGDVFDALKKITSGWFAFLDEAYRHFVPRLISAGMLQGSLNDYFDDKGFF